jgi:hypothetical protein
MSKCTKDAEIVYAPLGMVSMWGRERTLADKTVYQNGSNDTSFDPSLFSLDTTFKGEKGHTQKTSQTLDF